MRATRGSIRRPARAAAVLALAALLTACGGQPSGDPVAATDAPALRHLADELGNARVHAAPAPVAGRDARAWRFDQPRAEWTVAGHEQRASLAEASLQPLPDATRLSLRAPEGTGGMLIGGIVAQVDAGPVRAWAGVRVRARTHERLSGVAAACNVEDADAVPGRWVFMTGGQGSSPVFGDGSVQDYLLPLVAREPDAVLRSLGLYVGAPGAGSLDILSITLVPRGAEFEHDAGAMAVLRGGVSRHALYAHAPAELTFPLRVPAGGRLDVGLSGLAGEPLTHVVAVRADGVRQVLLDETLPGDDSWAQRSVDLSPWSGRDVELSLEAHATQADAVALWGAPIVSGAGRSQRPNILFYVIDGGGADQMSVYGYERKTTPFLEELAQQGVVFERAFSSATWTQPSTAAFMTGLHHSVLGGLRRGVHSTPVPDAAVTMAEHFRRGGWFTASLTTNPNCARVIGLQRGVDVMNDSIAEGDGTSSTALQQLFFELRAQYPQTPWWVHIQTTDVHEPNESVEPFAGRYVPASDREQLGEWEGQLRQAGGQLFGTTSILHYHDEALRLAGLDRHAYYDRHRGLYDETMAQQDDSLRAFVQQLRDSGAWENTLLVIGADHGHPAGTFSRWGRGLFEPKPPEWEGALFDSYATRVPLIVVWPGHVQAGRRIGEPVSMIDVLPTVLELAGLPPAPIGQGRSLAAALLGAPLPAVPLIFDEVRVDEASGEFVGNIELIDGSWGASLEIGPGPPGSDAARGRHAVPAGGRWGAVHPWFADVPHLLLYDLQADRFVRRSVNDEHPDLVQRYEVLLRERWQAHLALGRHFTQAGDSDLDPAQLEQLKQLGYVR